MTYELLSLLQLASHLNQRIIHLVKSKTESGTCSIGCL